MRESEGFETLQKREGERERDEGHAGLQGIRPQEQGIRAVPRISHQCKPAASVRFFFHFQLTRSIRRLTSLLSDDLRFAGNHMDSPGEILQFRNRRRSRSCDVSVASVFFSYLFTCALCCDDGDQLGFDFAFSFLANVRILWWKFGN